MIDLKEQQKHIAFIEAAPLVAHNLGDLDRVMVQWNMHETDPFCQKYFKLGSVPREDDSKIFVYSGHINKKFTAVENHRHLSMRKAKCIRKSKDFLISVGPFMDDWGGAMGKSSKLSMEEKAEIITALFDGHKRQKNSFGYARAFGSMINVIDGGFKELENYLPFDLAIEIKNSPFMQIAKRTKEEFELEYINNLQEFICPITKFKF